MQSLHAVAPLAFWNCPGSQLLHAPEPVALATVPGLHGKHALLLLAPVAGLCDPMGQGLQASIVLFPTASLKRPVGHGVHPPPQVAALAQNPPTAHSSQAVCPVAAWYLPRGHTSHSPAPI